MPIISQNLTVPPGLADGQTASASQILPLYNAMNAFNVPGTIGVLQQSLVDDTLYTQVVGTNPTKDWSFTTTQTQFKAGFYIIPYAWTGGAAPTITYRVNTTAVTGATATTNAATGSGLIVVFMGAGHTATIPRPLLIFQIDSGGTFATPTVTVNLAAADITSFGVTCGGGTTSFTFQHIRFWSEG